MKDIHKKINLNSLIEHYKGMYGGYVYCEKSMLYNYIDMYKVYTFLYSDYEFSILIVDHRYRLVDYKGDIYESNNIDAFNTIVKIRLWRVYCDI